MPAILSFFFPMYSTTPPSAPFKTLLVLLGAEGVLGSMTRSAVTKAKFLDPQTALTSRLSQDEKNKVEKLKQETMAIEVKQIKRLRPTEATKARKGIRGAGAWNNRGKRIHSRHLHSTPGHSSNYSAPLRYSREPRLLRDE
ncbi:hypothetical protein E2C01_005126 [Portunus trituberculatus]|uniref:Uncharacterized protein n=1 Tax=Portunus trituberculatus TaxID=210409 RepID=A0A5B7CRT1_PORTR|nr:hypothetical protein [Portunus trituberculatus]